MTVVLTWITSPARGQWAATHATDDEVDGESLGLEVDAQVVERDVGRVERRQPELVDQVAEAEVVGQTRCHHSWGITGRQIELGQPVADPRRESVPARLELVHGGVGRLQGIIVDQGDLGDIVDAADQVAGLGRHADEDQVVELDLAVTDRRQRDGLHAVAGLEHQRRRRQREVDAELGGEALGGHGDGRRLRDRGPDQLDLQRERRVRRGALDQGPHERLALRIRRLAHEPCLREIVVVEDLHVGHRHVDAVASDHDREELVVGLVGELIVHELDAHERTLRRSGRDRHLQVERHVVLRCLGRAVDGVHAEGQWRGDDAVEPEVQRDLTGVLGVGVGGRDRHRRLDVVVEDGHRGRRTAG